MPFKSMGQEIPGDLSDNQWELSSSKFECRLNNHIPGMGDVFLLAGAGRIEKLFLNPDPYEAYAREAEVILEPSPWQGHDHRHFIASGMLDKGEPLDIKVNVPFMVESFQQGMQLVLSIKRAKLEPVMLKVPALDFKLTAKNFYACFSELLVLNFQQAEETLIYYNSSRYRLRDVDKKHLKHLAEYILTDEFVEHVDIDAHTDSRGSELSNRELSKKRGNAIAKRLKQLGVPESKIHVRFHGERYPAASNETVEGRNKNRRVKIKLIRR